MLRLSTHVHGTGDVEHKLYACQGGKCVNKYDFISKKKIRLFDVSA